MSPYGGHVHIPISNRNCRWSLGLSSIKHFL